MTLKNYNNVLSVKLGWTEAELDDRGLFKNIYVDNASDSGYI